MLQRKNTALQLGQFLALVASLLIAAQIGYTLYQGAPLCLNSGCKVVEKLTKVSPMVFNVAGFLFFQVVYWGLRAARGEMRRLPGFVKTVLLAALAAEAVLIGFQYLTAQTFCAYCLGVLAFVVLLNLLLGWRQIAAGVLIFTTAALAFASLELNQSAAPGRQAFTAGVFATRPGLLKYPENYLFYSSTCAHCEKVIAALKTNARVTISFNPIDQVTSIDLPKTTVHADYSPSLNKALLTSLGIAEIPVLMTRNADGWTIRQGESAVTAYLAGTGRTQPAGVGQSSGSSTAPAGQLDIPGLQSGGNGCQVSSDCTSDAAGQSTVR
jgi:hypothetical protein